MDFEELTDYIVQNCFIELEDYSADIVQNIHLNLALRDTPPEKVEYLKTSIAQKKSELGKLVGNEALSIHELYMKFQGFENYTEFNDMLDKLFENNLKEYIDWTIGDYDIKNDPSEQNSLTNSASEKYVLIKPWVKAASNLITLLYLKKDLETLEKSGEVEKHSITPIKRAESRYLKFNDGRRLNLQERYHLIDKIAGIDDIIKNRIRKEKQEEVLAFILHCNPKNAQQVLYGSYDGKLREEEIKKYVEDIKKE